MKEIWRDIREYEGRYQVSNLGRVKSLKRTIDHSGKYKRTVQERILTPRKKIDGSIYYGLWKNDGDKNMLSHRLVYRAFVGDLINGLVVDHIDHDQTNNHISNLQQISNRENCSKDKWRYNTTSKHVGVFFDKKWRAAIYINGVINYLGSYSNESEAAEAYQTKLREISNVC